MEQSNATERARQMAEQQKENGAEQISGMAGAIHGAARQLEDDMPLAAGYVHDAASFVERTAERLKERGVEDLLREVNGFARARPTAFFGGAVLAGFVVSRFLKSSGRSMDRRTDM
jgi:hypothetical protein